jgi:restriction system protein
MDEVNIPKFDEFLSPILKYANDGKEHNLSETIDEMAEEFNLNEKQKNLLMPNGKRTYIYDRVAWAITYLVQAGLLLRTGRSKFVISDTGREEAKIMPKKITYDYLTKFESYNKFKELKHQRKQNKKNNGEIMETGLTPDEEIENIFEKRNEMLVQDLLKTLYSIKPSDFERVIIDVVLALGYGKNYEEMARVIGQPGDQGIDGEISQDKLGFDKIYLQAKRWGPEQTVGGRDIRDFIGALATKRAKKGIFITTTKFSKEALETAKKDPEHTIILIDGTDLSKLMIDYNVGIRETKKYTLKEIDKDYFESFDN